MIYVLNEFKDVFVVLRVKVRVYMDNDMLLCGCGEWMVFEDGWLLSEVYSGVGMEGGVVDMMVEECGMWCISEGCWMVYDMSDLFGWGW